jgi:dihydroflavonol-4-reductase
MRVFVTGATGFVGRHLCRALVRAGHSVRALRRATSNISVLDDCPVDWVIGDLLDEQSLAAALAGSDAVFHIAASLGYARQLAAEHARINVGGTRTVVRAALAAKVKRLVHTSSVVAIGPAPPGKVADESTPYAGSRLRLSYFDTKASAEAEVMAAHRQGLDAVIVNPAAVFGADTSNNSSLVLRKVAQGGGRVAPPGGLCVVAVEDVVRGHLLALERGRGGERYILGGDNLTYAELFALIHRVVGRQVRVHTVPGGLWQLACIAAEGIDHVMTLRPPLTPDALRALGARLAYSSAKAERELGYRHEPALAVIERVIAALPAA